MTSASSPDRAGLLALSAAAFLSMAAMRACDPLLPALALAFSASTGAAAQTISAFAIAYGFLQLLYGPLADRYGKFRVIALAVLGCTAGSAAAVFATSLDALVLARVLAGAAAAGIIPQALAWVGDAVSYESRQEVLAHLLTATLLGTAFGQWMAGALADAYGWRAVFVMLTGMFFVLGVVLVLMSRRRDRTASTRDAPSFIAGLRQVLRVPWARSVLLVTAVEGAFAFSAAVFIPAFAHERFGLSLRHSALVAALFALGGLVYALRARVLVERLGERGLVLGGAGLLAAAFALVPLLPHWGWMAPVCLAAGLGFSMLHSTLQTHATQMVPSLRGTAVSLFGSSLFFGQSLGVLAASAVVDTQGFGTVFVVAALAIAALGIFFERALVGRQRT